MYEVLRNRCCESPAEHFFQFLRLVSGYSLSDLVSSITFWQLHMLSIQLSPYVRTYVRLYFPLYSCLRDFRHLACPFVPRASKFLFHSFPSRRYHNSQPLFSAGMGASPASSCIYLLGCCHVKHSAQKFKCGSSQPLWPPFLFISPANFTLVRLAKKFCLFIFFFFFATLPGANSPQRQECETSVECRRQHKSSFVRRK